MASVARAERVADAALARARCCRYAAALRQQVQSLLRGQHKTVTAFAYGQTGSGKTFTMEGLQRCVATEVFTALAVPGAGHVTMKNGTVRKPSVAVSMFQLLGNTSTDLLNNKVIVAAPHPHRRNVPGYDTVLMRAGTCAHS